MKKILALLLALVFVLGVAACGGGGSGTPAPAGGGSTAPAGGGGGSAPAGGGGSTPAGGGAAAPTGPQTPAEADLDWVNRPEVTLILTNQDPDHSLPGRYGHLWAEAIHEESRGRIEIQVNNGGTLAGATQSLEFVKNGIVDIAFGLPSFFPGQFPMTDALLMPMLPYRDSVHASEVFMDVWYNTDLLKSDPGYDGVHVLMLRANCDTPIITGSRKLNSVEDLRGMTIRATIAPLVNWLAEFGATGQGCPIGELFQNLQNGAFDGALTDWHAVNAYRFHEVANFFAYERVQFNMYFFLMNLDVYNSLSPENKAVIDKLSGPGAFEIMKDAWDELAEQVKAEVRAMQGSEVYQLPAADSQLLREAAERTNAQYIASLGEPGRQLYERVMQLTR